MLESIDGATITKLPHKKDYDRWIKSLKEEESEAIFDEINRIIDTADVHTAGWMPGSEWEKTPFYPIYEKACKKNAKISGLFFGLLVFKVFMDRHERWIFGRFENNGKPIHSITYFKPKKTT